MTQAGTLPRENPGTWGLRILRAGFPEWHFVVAALAFSALCKMVS